MIKTGNDWEEILMEETETDYFKELIKKVEEEYERTVVYPAKENIFASLKYTAYKDVSVLLLGQDPYHGENQAHGLCFSVLDGVKKPPSLVNMMKELKSDTGIEISESGCLVPWAKQGVLMLNTVLTVLEGQPNSHKNLGWTRFTDKIISVLNERRDPVIFLLWGANAKEKLGLITNPWHFVLEAPHPSPLSASKGFFGCRHYSKVNTILKRLGKTPIDWNINR
ncbi:MAG: uracil-DNA glycosylase [Ruminococcaceae bacterium]|nr:uracil-DNA glycosylase [Oscillospiraceae bacterium]